MFEIFGRKALAVDCLKGNYMDSFEWNRPEFNLKVLLYSYFCICMQIIYFVTCCLLLSYNDS